MVIAAPESESDVQASKAAQAPTEAISFGAFRLLPRQRALLRANERVSLGSRALDILVELATRPGETVSTADLMHAVWPGLVVGENTLRVHISALRKVLGDNHEKGQYIANRNGRGYAFVAPVTRGMLVSKGAQQPKVAKLPVRRGRVVGRSEEVKAIVAQLSDDRLVTITGPGGIGKTVVALEVAHITSGRFPDGAVFIDFASVSEPSAIASLILSSLGSAARSDEILQEVGRLVEARQMLIVLDTCEHVVGEVGRVADAILTAAPNVRVLATSRQPLGARDEYVFRLPPLAYPEDSAVGAHAARSYPAIELFVQKSLAAGSHYIFDDLEAPLLAKICRHLDGLPLAIEIAAARLGQFGSRDLLVRLEESVAVLDDGLPSGLPRHHTLRATLDWSYGLLSDEEKKVFESISVFRSPFSGEAVRALAEIPGGSESTLATMQSLCLKSLVSSAILGGTVHYVMLDTNRVYAHAKLMASGELSSVYSRLAEYLIKVLASREAGNSVEWPTAEELRAALDWAFSDSGDTRLGINLTLHATPYWFAFSQLETCHAGVLRAINAG